jgi:ProP effector
MTTLTGNRMKPTLRLKLGKNPPAPVTPAPTPSPPLQPTTELPSDRQQQTAAVALRRQLIRIYPGAFKNFKSAKLPLKVGIRADILAAMPDVEPKLIEAALREYCYRGDYQRYLTEGAGRVNLQGEVVGTVSTEEARHAAACMKRKKVVT